jgi:hypothetical protein
MRVELTNADVIRLVVNEIAARTGTQPDLKRVKIETKSAQNYRSEWEIADFRAVYETLD